MCNLVIPVGIPGSGKSTWTEMVLGHGKYSIVSSDAIRKHIHGSLRAAHDVDLEEKQRRNKAVWGIFYRRVEDQVEHGVDTIADATNLRQSARGKLLEIAESAGAKTHVILFGNVLEALERNRVRDDDLVVPDDVMEDFLVQFDQAFTDLTTLPHHYESITMIGSLR